MKPSSQPTNQETAKKISSFFCTSHILRAPDKTTLQLILDWGKKNNVVLKFSKELSSFSNMPEAAPEDEAIFLRESAEMILVFGGDGTIISAVRNYADYNLPFAGINFGNLGFLTTADPKNMLSVFEHLKNGIYCLENRMMLNVSVKREGEEVFSCDVLNEVAMQRLLLKKASKIDVYISGTHVSSYEGDGVIFATPTGSTAYALSAGGPIVPPWVNLILISPLNCHTLAVRSVLTSEDEIITATLENPYSELILVLDGQKGYELKTGDQVEVKKSKKNCRTVITDNGNFFDILRRKMGWG